MPERSKNRQILANKGIASKMNNERNDYMEWLKQYFSVIPVLTQRGLNQLKLATQWHQLSQELQLFLEIAVISQPEGLTAEQFNRWVNQTKVTNNQISSDIKDTMSTSASNPLAPSRTITTDTNENSFGPMGTNTGATTLKESKPKSKGESNPFRTEIDKLREWFDLKTYTLFKDITKTTGAPIGTITGSYYKKNGHPKQAMIALAKYKEALRIKERQRDVTVEAKVKKLNDLKVLIEADDHKLPHPDAFRYVVVQQGDFKFTQYYQTLNLDTEKPVWTENPNNAHYFTYEEVLKATETLQQEGYQVATRHVEKA